MTFGAKMTWFPKKLSVTGYRLWVNRGRFDCIHSRFFVQTFTRPPRIRILHRPVTVSYEVEDEGESRHLPW